MDGFQTTVVVIAIIILLFTLLIIGLALSYAKQESWPPIVPECPDYWVAKGSSDISGGELGVGPFCVNIKDLGTCPPKQGQKHLIMNFGASPFTGDEGDCNKYNWANRCNVSWDGITYGVKNPCESSTDENLT